MVCNRWYQLGALILVLCDCMCFAVVVSVAVVTVAAASASAAAASFGVGDRGCCTRLPRAMERSRETENDGESTEEASWNTPT